jgi:GT2 family glycosyltransferase
MPDKTENLIVSVIIITRNRADMVKKCLDHLRQQTYTSIETILVDSSTDFETKNLVRDEYSYVKYLFLPNGRNRMQDSRNLGIKHSNGNIIGFLDDDSMASPEWVEEIVKSYTNESIGAVGGLVLEPFGPSEESSNGRPIGTILPNGERVTNYHLNPGKTIEVDLVRGCNMSFHRRTIQQIGGFDPAFTGSNAFEAGDYCARVKNAGYKVLFNPMAKVLHLSAKREDIPRELSDPRTQFYQARNWTLWVGKNLGWKKEHLYHLWLEETKDVFQKRDRTLNKQILITTANLLGKSVGTWAWMQWRYFGKKEPTLDQRSG